MAVAEKDVRERQNGIDRAVEILDALLRLRAPARHPHARALGTGGGGVTRSTTRACRAGESAQARG